MTLLPVTLRDAEPADVQGMICLLEQLFSIEKDFVFNAEKHEKGLMLMLEGCGKHRTVKVAVTGNRLVGMVSAQTRISTAEGRITAVLEDLVVDRDFHGRGIGRSLLKAACAWAQKRGIICLQLLADADNKPALSFYKRLDWQLTSLVCLTRRL